MLLLVFCNLQILVFLLDHVTLRAKPSVHFATSARIKALDSEALQVSQQRLGKIPGSLLVTAPIRRDPWTHFPWLQSSWQRQPGMHQLNQTKLPPPPPTLHCTPAVVLDYGPSSMADTLSLLGNGFFAAQKYAPLCER